MGTIIRRVTAEREEAIRQSKLIEYLGIIEYFDEYANSDEYTDVNYSDLSYDEFLDVFVPSNYKDRIEYENDQAIALDLIYSDKKIPQELVSKLLKARIERDKIEKEYFKKFQM